MNTQRILHILSGDLWAGRETQLMLQLAALRAQGWEASALLFNDAETAKRFREAGLAVAIADERHGMRVLIGSALAAARQLKPALLVAHGYKEALVTFVLSRQLGVPWISTFHGATEKYAGMKALKKTVYGGLQHGLSRWSAAAMVTVSKSLARTLKLERNPRLHVIYNVAPAAAPAAASPPSPDPARKIALVGRLVPVKRIDRGLRAFCRMREINRELQDTVLLVVGDGPMRYSLEQLKAGLPGAAQIQFLGQRSDAAELIHCADLLLISSDSEGIPTVLLEAAAGCVPIVSTDVGGIAEVLALLPGYPAELVPAADEKRLAEAMSRMLSQPVSFDCSRIKELFAEHFLPSVAAEQHGALYRKVLRL